MVNGSSSFRSIILSYCCGVWLAVQLSATLRTEVTASVFAALALTVEPALAPVSGVPDEGDPDVPAELVSGVLAEAVALAPAVPTTSTSLLTFEANSESSPCS